MLCHLTSVSQYKLFPVSSSCCHLVCYQSGHWYCWQGAMQVYRFSKQGHCHLQLPQQSCSLSCWQNRGTTWFGPPCSGLKILGPINSPRGTVKDFRWWANYLQYHLVVSRQLSEVPGGLKSGNWKRSGLQPTRVTVKLPRGPGCHPPFKSAGTGSIWDSQENPLPKASFQVW